MSATEGLFLGCARRKTSSVSTIRFTRSSGDVSTSHSEIPRRRNRHTRSVRRVGRADCPRALPPETRRPSTCTMTRTCHSDAPSASLDSSRVTLKKVALIPPCEDAESSGCPAMTNAGRRTGSTMDLRSFCSSTAPTAPSASSVRRCRRSTELPRRQSRSGRRRGRIPPACVMFALREGSDPGPPGQTSGPSLGSRALCSRAPLFNGVPKRAWT